MAWSALLGILNLIIAAARSKLAERERHLVILVIGAMIKFSGRGFIEKSRSWAFNDVV
jgi:uncharacterized membrane protein YGL010W